MHVKTLIAAVVIFASCIGFADPLAAQRTPEAVTQTDHAARPGPACPAGQSAMIRLELVFGMSRKSGTGVTEGEWQKFVDDEITPRFPDGLTVLTGYGQWRGGDGAIIRETSRMLLVWHAPRATADADVEQIRSAWKAQQDQESVLRAESAACVGF